MICFQLALFSDSDLLFLSYVVVCFALIFLLSSIMSLSTSNMRKRRASRNLSKLSLSDNTSVRGKNSSTGKSVTSTGAVTSSAELSSLTQSTAHRDRLIRLLDCSNLLKVPDVHKRRQKWTTLLLLCAAFLDGVVAVANVPIVLAHSEHVSFPSGLSLMIYQLIFLVPQMISSQYAERVARVIGEPIALAATLFTSAVSMYVVSFSVSYKQLSLFYVARFMNGLFRHDKLLFELISEITQTDHSLMRAASVCGTIAGMLTSGFAADMIGNSVIVTRGFAAVEIFSAAVTLFAIKFYSLPLFNRGNGSMNTCSRKSVGAVSSADSSMTFSHRVSGLPSVLPQNSKTDSANECSNTLPADLVTLSKDAPNMSTSEKARTPTIVAPYVEWVRIVLPLLLMQKHSASPNFLFYFTVALAASVNQSVYPLKRRDFFVSYTFMGAHLAFNIAFQTFIIPRLLVLLKRLNVRNVLIVLSFLLCMGYWFLPYVENTNALLYYSGSFFFVDIPAGLLCSFVTERIVNAFPAKEKPFVVKFLMHILQVVKLFSAPLRVSVSEIFSKESYTVRFISMPLALFAWTYVITDHLPLALSSGLIFELGVLPMLRNITRQDIFTAEK